jgi:hypothetical protein
MLNPDQGVISRVSSGKTGHVLSAYCDSSPLLIQKRLYLSNLRLVY